MNKQLLYFILISATFTVTGCTLIGDIFKAGVWVGILVVVFVIVLIIWLLSRMGKKG